MKYVNHCAAIEAEISYEWPYQLVIRDLCGVVRMEGKFKTSAQAIMAMHDFCKWEKVEENEERETAHSPHSSAVEAANRFLTRNGCTVLEIDWTCPHGRCDIIALDGEALAFIEVKERGTDSDELPCEAANAAKREQMELIAIDYLDGHFFGEAVVRFDVISLREMSHGRSFIRHHIGAHSA